MAFATGSVVMREPLVPPKSWEVRARCGAGDCVLFIGYDTTKFGMPEWVRGNGSVKPCSKRDCGGRGHIRDFGPDIIEAERDDILNSPVCRGHIRDFGPDIIEAVGCCSTEVVNGRVTFGTSVPTSLKRDIIRIEVVHIWSHSGLRSRHH